MSGRLAPPSYRVIQCAFDDLESQIRRRDRYTLEHVTQNGETYTLFFLLKEKRESGLSEHVED